MNKIILRNILFTVAIGIAALLVPRAADTCDAKCQCMNNTEQAYLECVNFYNSAPCSACANPGACLFDWPVTSACTGGYRLDLCDGVDNCAASRDSDMNDCSWGC